jgi:transposase InsO family protein
MYHDLKAQFLWTRIKREIDHYVAECDTCRRVKADHLRPASLLQPLNTPAWKWEEISTDFIVGLPLAARKYDYIWVIVDRFTKFIHFILIHSRYKTKRYVELYIECILCLHGVPNTIISDRGAQFIAHFWEQLHASLGTHLIHSSAYHPQTNGQTECVNQVLEDMLCVCVMNYRDSWDKCLSLAEFSYNNTYQESLKVAPF